MSAITAINTRERMIRQWIQQACDANDVPELASKIQLRWSTRMTSTGGTACYATNVITLSSQLYIRATLEQRRWLVKHETCHLICACKHGFGVAGHGIEWKRCMKAAGCKPVRCHNINTVGLGPKRRGNRQLGFCGCANHWFTPKQMKRIKNGVVFWCQEGCRQKVRIA